MNTVESMVRRVQMIDRTGSMISRQMTVTNSCLFYQQGLEDLELICKRRTLSSYLIVTGIPK